MHRSPPTRRGRLAATGALVAAVAALALPAAASAGQASFAYTGAAQTWTVPAGVTRATFDVYGAQGGSYFAWDAASKGGRATATIAVTPGETFQINVGGRGGDGPSAAGGFNGGGAAGSSNNNRDDGGASDVRRGGVSLQDRIIVAAGGGNGYNGGGAGGGSKGAHGNAGGGGGGAGSTGSTQTAGGGGGSGYGPDGVAFQSGVRAGDGLVTITTDTTPPTTTIALSPRQCGWPERLVCLQPARHRQRRRRAGRQRRRRNQVRARPGECAGQLRRPGCRVRRRRRRRPTRPVRRQQGSCHQRRDAGQAGVQARHDGADRDVRDRAELPAQRERRNGHRDCQRRHLRACPDPGLGRGRHQRRGRQGISCSLDSTADQLEEVAAGASGLQNLGDGNYQLNWKSPTSYAGSCKRLRLDLGEGSYHTADFKFTR